MTDAERWAAIPEFRGYEISTLGRVRSYLTNGAPGRPLRKEPRVIKLQTDKLGRSVVTLAHPFGKRTRVVDQLVATAFGGES